MIHVMTSKPPMAISPVITQKDGPTLRALVANWVTARHSGTMAPSSLAMHIGQTRPETLSFEKSTQICLSTSWPQALRFRFIDFSVNPNTPQFSHAHDPVGPQQYLRRRLSSSFIYNLKASPTEPTRPLHSDVLAGGLLCPFTQWYPALCLEP